MSKVSIIITAYSEKSKPYLDMLIESVRNLDYQPDEVILVSPSQYAPKYEGVKTISPPGPEDKGNDAAINFGLENAAKDSEYFFILNDDVLLTRESLRHLVMTSQACSNTCLLMPWGNDTQNRVFLHSPIPPGQYRHQQIKNISKDLMNCSSAYPNGLVFYDTLCLYAFLLPKVIYHEIGGMDDNFHTGPSDIDYTLRVVRAGFRNAIVLNALVFHAGGVTADLTQDSCARARNASVFESKWGKGVLEGISR